MEAKTLGLILQGKNCGKFKNDKNEQCTISRFFINNKLKYQIVFPSNVVGEPSKRPAINTTSEKKILKLLQEENFQLII